MPLADAAYLVCGGTDDPFLPHLLKAIDEATSIQIAVAFTLQSGLRLVFDALADALARQVSLQFLTSDYLDVTEPAALRRLLLLQDAGGSVRLYASTLGGPFHPKAYIFTNSPAGGVAFVGSSNLTESALVKGIEWNLCIDSRVSPGAFAQATKGFTAIFHHPASTEISWENIAHYEKRRKPPQLDFAEQPVTLPRPNDAQLRALEALRDSRSAGLQRALIVMATGVGKTWLAIFDILQGAYQRILFIAHREEILNQAAEAFLTVMPQAKIGFYHGNAQSIDADILFGSVATLGRKTHLNNFARDAFDYVVIDEFHHAAANSYQNILNHFSPAFLLGLTATPDRTDGADIEALCDSNVPFRLDLTEAIEADFLCPFSYFGIHDRHVDYENIPWRSRRFAPEEIEDALATEARSAQIFSEWRKRGQACTLGFCVSVNHADYMAAYFQQRGVRAVAVHSRSTTRRHEALDGLAARRYQIVFCVDLFNEGVDLPAIDTVLMIRPTMSPIVYLQQLGRGLRLQKGKKRLVVLDFIGNHRSFLQGPQALFGIRPGSPEFTAALKAFKSGEFPLPKGCEINFDLEVIGLLGKMARINRDPDKIYDYLKELNGRRPTALEMHNYGVTFTKIKNIHGSWIQMLHARGDLAAGDFQQLFGHLRFFREMEKTSLTKCFKLITLEAMIELGGFVDPPGTTILADKALSILLRRPLLLDDIHQRFHPPEKTRSGMVDDWHRYWLDNPINALTGGNLAVNQREKTFFKVDQQKFTYTGKVSTEALELFESLLQEIVNCRLVGYNHSLQKTDEVVCKLINSGDRPIIKLNDSLRSFLPDGETEVLINGKIYRARFAQIAVNVIQDEAGGNVLTEILRGWFGAKAGMPGEADRVIFKRRGKNWELLPVLHTSKPTEPKPAPQQQDSAPPRLTLLSTLLDNPSPQERYRSCVPFYSLRPAAGKFGLNPGVPLDQEPQGWMPVEDAQPDMFVLEVTGHSMEPDIPDGAFCLFRAGSALGGSRNGRVVLVQNSGRVDPETGSTFTVKKYFSTKTADPITGWRHDKIILKPTNPDYQEIHLHPGSGEEFSVIAEFFRVIE